MSQRLRKFLFVDSSENGCWNVCILYATLFDIQLLCTASVTHS